MSPPAWPSPRRKRVQRFHVGHPRSSLQGRPRRALTQPRPRLPLRPTQDAPQGVPVAVACPDIPHWPLIHKALSVRVCQSVTSGPHDGGGRRPARCDRGGGTGGPGGVIARSRGLGNFPPNGPLSPTSVPPQSHRSPTAAPPQVHRSPQPTGAPQDLLRGY